MDDKVTTMVPHLSEEENGKWGMVINQDLCTGCQACVAACSMENNISFVGEEDAGYGRTMHWLRIEHFWDGEYPYVNKTPYQPVLCQHCGSAPCEPVCPVYATVHSESQELNVQVYNRCVGTRYCGNNCPYQVRTFNWRDWDRPDPLSNQLNPDVTVRRRGVMEKCSYCTQRISEARIKAKNEGREIADGEVVSACQQACPTKAITFGNINDPNSAVSKAKENNRRYELLAEINAVPRTSFLAKLRNPNPELV